MGVKLDEYQQRYVDEDIYPNKAILVKAVAGSGKSTSSVVKVKKMIDDKEYRPDEILLTTFSNKAARDLISKSRKIIGKKSVPDVGTSHSICLGILKSTKQYEKYSTLTEWNYTLLVRDVIEDLGYSSKDMKKSQLNEWANEIIDTLAYLTATLNFDRDAIDRGTFKVTDYVEEVWFHDTSFVKIVREVERRKNNLRVFSYDDILYVAYENIQTLRKVNKWELAVCDEAQDFTLLQFEIFTNLFKGKALIMIGDDAQSIYGWRFADVTKFSKEYLGTKFKEVAVLPLARNYRSTSNIVELGNIVREVMGDSLKAEPHRERVPQSVRMVTVRNDAQEGLMAAETIQKLIDEGADYREIAIITRTNNFVKTVVEPAFVKRNIPYRLSGRLGKRFTEKSLNRLYVDILSYIVNPDNHYSAIGIASQLKGVGDSFIEQLRKVYNKCGYDKECAREYMTGSTYSKLLRLDRVLEQIREISTKEADDIPELFQSIKELIYEEVRITFGRDELETLETGLRNWIMVVMQDEKLNLVDTINSLLTDINSFDDDNSDSVTIYTTHSTKGLEFKYVIALGFSTKTMREYGREEACVLYVQLSRAIEKLYIINSHTSVTGRKMYPNPWLMQVKDILSS